jgi:DNA-binding NtrC family response regulator
MLETVILLVDDEVGFVEAFSKRLKKRNFTVFTAHSGKDALDVLKEHPTIDVIILDVLMPVMDGIETLKEIKRHHPLVEVIMLSGHATIESAIEGMKLGAFDYLMKPCDLDELTEKVKQVKKRRNEHKRKILEAQMQDITLRRGV